MGYPKGFLHRKVEIFSGHFWVFLSKLMQTLLWVFTRIFFRYYSAEAMNSAYASNFCLENNQIGSSDSELNTEAAAEIFESLEDTELKFENLGALSDTLSHESNQIDSKTVDDSGSFGLEEEGTTALVFKFDYQSWNCDELEGSYDESCDFSKRDAISSSTNNKYEFISGKSFSLFLDEPEASNFTVKELYLHSDDDFPLENHVTNDSGSVSQKKFMPENCIGGGVNSEIGDNSIEQPLEPVVDNLLSDDDSICSRFDSDSMVSMGDGFLSDTDFGTTIELDSLRNIDEENGGLTEEDLDFEDERNSVNLDDVGYEPDDFGEEDEDIMEELRKLEDSNLQNSDIAGKEDKDNINSKPEGFVKPNSQSLTAFDLEDSSRFDTLWEHQDLIEQLKMELKKVRAMGLPTILEDSESPRIMEDLKPWKIDEKFQHGSATNELPKFYRSYRERMRKFDILNYQKMYAIGFLQSKDPLQSFSSRKNSSPAITCILPQSFRLLRRPKNTEPDPMKKFIGDLYSDLEMVYVGQLCLSWEFLRWEYEKALELWESDQYGLRRFNEVAGEFQQFQVLLQRFMENEPFQGPRVENYARNRCVMRNLLQVPVIREDNTKDKMKFRKTGTDKDAITSDMLVEILEESIRTIWRYIRADKDASCLTLKGQRETEIELQDPADFELLMEIRTDLQKKEKRLRDLLRSGSCILKKFKKHQEDETEQVLYFFSQVDLKLVWRVLNMSRITTDQLAWCRSILKKINFVNRRIHVEPSFLLFPSL